MGSMRKSTDASVENAPLNINDWSHKNASTQMSASKILLKLGKRSPSLAHLGISVCSPRQSRHGIHWLVTFSLHHKHAHTHTHTHTHTRMLSRQCNARPAVAAYNFADHSISPVLHRQLHSLQEKDITHSSEPQTEIMMRKQKQNPT